MWCSLPSTFSLSPKRRHVPRRAFEGKIYSILFHAIRYVALLNAIEMGFNFIRERYVILVFCLPGDVSTLMVFCKKWIWASPFFFKGGLPVEAYLDSGSYGDGYIQRVHAHSKQAGSLSMNTQLFCTSTSLKNNASAHICYAESKDSGYGPVLLKEWVLPFSSPQSITCSWNSFTQTPSLMFSATLHISNFTIQALHTLL